MKRALICALCMALVLCTLPVDGNVARAATPGFVGVMFEGGKVNLGSRLGGVPVKSIRFSSSDEAVATVSGGKICAHAAGAAVLTAKYRGLTRTCGVLVLPRKVSVKVGESVQLPGTGWARYYVEHGKIASISQKGKITGRQQGSTRIGIACGSQKMIVKLTVAGGASASGQGGVGSLDCAAKASQIVLVEYQSESRAKLSIHQKQGGAWKQLYSCTACVGRNGIDKEREGDGRTPTGTYNLTTPFGIKADPGSNMGYTKVTKYHYWCGSSDSTYYNHLVDEREEKRACTASDEHLIDYKGVYNYCMFIDYNASGEPGLGSCIFLHCKDSKESTAGCIAVDESVMKNIIRWAQPGCKIVIR